MISEPVNPVRPIAPYLGGKRLLSKRIVGIINTIQHSTYVEPFVGMGGVFFRRTARPRKEVINDINSDVTLLFRWLQRHYQQVLDALKWQICSRRDFDRLVNTDPAVLTELERVARFIFIQRVGFGGKVASRSYGVTRTCPARFDLSKLVPMLEDVHERLCGVDIECMPYQKLIAIYDTPQTLFYLDPPYFGHESDYGNGVFAQSDFTQIRCLMERIQGTCILSINDRPEVRQIFAGMRMEEVELTYSVSGSRTPARELIIIAGGADH